MAGWQNSEALRRRLERGRAQKPGPQKGFRFKPGVKLDHTQVDDKRRDKPYIPEGVLQPPSSYDKGKVDYLHALKRRSKR